MPRITGFIEPQSPEKLSEDTDSKIQVPKYYHHKIKVTSSFKPIEKP